MGKKNLTCLNMTCISYKWNWFLYNTLILTFYSWQRTSWSLKLSFNTYVQPWHTYIYKVHIHSFTIKWQQFIMHTQIKPGKFSLMIFGLQIRIITIKLLRLMFSWRELITCIKGNFLCSVFFPNWKNQIIWIKLYYKLNAFTNWNNYSL